jgi:hypothetical protein
MKNLTNIYESSLHERFELYLEQLKIEIESNEKLLYKYSKGVSQSNVLEYFLKKLNDIKRDYEGILRRI